jgi:hypothetical protein
MIMSNYEAKSPSLNKISGAKPSEIPPHFLNQKIMIEAFGYRIEGKIIHYQTGMKKNHLPDCLIVQNEKGVHILRGWTVLKVST